MRCLLTAILLLSNLAAEAFDSKKALSCIVGKDFSLISDSDYKAIPIRTKHESGFILLESDGVYFCKPPNSKNLISAGLSNGRTRYLKFEAGIRETIPEKLRLATPPGPRVWGIDERVKETNLYTPYSGTEVNVFDYSKEDFTSARCARRLDEETGPAVVAAIKERVEKLGVGESSQYLCVECDKVKDKKDWSARRLKDLEKCEGIQEVEAQVTKSFEALKPTNDDPKANERLRHK